VKRILFSPFLVPIEPPVIDDALRHALADLLEPDVYRLRQFTGKAFPDWSI
jgi:hypothetical protein